VKVGKGRRVRIKIHLAVVGGETLEKSVVEYIHGGGTMLPALEMVLVGLEPGARREGKLKAAEAFGNPRMHPIKKMARAEFPAGADLKPGLRFTAKGANNGLDVVLQVEKATASEVEVRLVHPLADKDLTYDIEVVSVVDPEPPPMPAVALRLEDS
jgi:FKBP-type peptidyl-prolyl cis-trans isomerase 2